jgi:Holliday junction resolvase RusA-like endonuclease
MDIKVYWMNGNHGDPDNIFKGLADALFINDKFLDGSFETNNAPDGKGRVVITITHNQ